MNSLIIFKNNLRVKDNPPLFYGSKNNKVIPLFIYDNVNIKKELGSASKYWLYHALNSLNESLNSNLLFYKGDSKSIIKSLVKKHSISSVFCEEPFLENDIILFEKIKKILDGLNVSLKFYNSTLLWEPYSILKDDESPYRVFTPFYRKGCLGRLNPKYPLGDCEEIDFLDLSNDTKIDDLELLDEYKWYDKFEALWNISENSALNILHKFLHGPISNYKIGRDFPSSNYNSRLSPFIRFGMISINRIWWEVDKLTADKNIEHYKSELGWREFSYYLMYHFPEMESQNLQSKFDDFEWENSSDKFESWKRGETGFPIIDAGMKELWKTGYMHNRIRMVVASFLVKNLSVDWKLGESWFWDCLLDADFASNIAGWQWVAGTGADAAPYFRIFNPILQGEKFDSKGIYTMKYIPELKKIPIKFLQKPWESDIEVDYPKPIINYRESRENALLKYSFIK